jgi:hypothetical protein
MKHVFWITMICVVLGAGAIGAENGPSPAPARPKLLDQLRAGPMAGVTDLVFAAHKMNDTEGTTRVTTRGERTDQ